MNKTVHLNFIGKNVKSGTGMPVEDVAADDFIWLLQEMKGFLKEATIDLLQPRPEAIVKLLQKVNH